MSAVHLEFPAEPREPRSSDVVAGRPTAEPSVATMRRAAGSASTPHPRDAAGRAFDAAPSLGERLTGRWRLWAAALAVAALLWRLPALWYAYPFEGTPDEWVLVESAVRILRSGDLNPHVFNYPSLDIYVLAAVDAVLEPLGVLRVEARATPDHYVVARALVLLASALTIFASACLGSRCFGPRVGVATAAVLAVAPLHTAFSYVARVDASVALWAVLAAICALRILVEPPRTRDYVLAAGCVGCAIGSKYTAIFAALPIAFAHFLGEAPLGRASWRRLAWFAVLVPLCFLATTPYALLDLAGFRTELAMVREAYRVGVPGHAGAGPTSYGANLRELVEGFGLALSVLAVLGVGSAARREPRRVLVLLAFPLGLVALLGAYAAHFARNLVGATPFVAVFAAVGLASVVDALRRAVARLPAGSASARRTWTACAVALACFAAFVAPASVSAAELRLARVPDARGAASQWLRAHVPPGSRVLCEQRGPPLDAFAPGCDVTVVRCAVEARRHDPATGFDFVVLSAWTLRCVAVERPEFAPLRAAYERFEASHELVAEFVADGIRLSGDSIRVYRGAPRAPDSPPSAASGAR
ncbi:MAG: glycosyltransferase family 39 protein [Planctomycetes bacterium]|nr:glycosyltransferase family 39 protein [Planctomycetota bacterium]